MLGRRQFLANMSAFIAGSMLDPERLLWVPGEKTIFLPPTVTENALLSIDFVTREALRMLERNLKFTSMINRQFDRSFL